MKSSTYYQGNGHSKYGIYNQKIGEDAKKWRFEVREVTE